MALTDLRSGPLTLKVVPGRDTGAIVVQWLGRAGERRPGEILTPWFTNLAEEAAATSRSIEFRFEDIEHFNSSTIAVLMQFLLGLQQRGIRLRLVYRSELKWQKMTFGALRQFEGPGKILVLTAV